MTVLIKPSIFNGPDIALYSFRRSFIFFLAVCVILQIFVRCLPFIEFGQQTLASLNYLIYFFVCVNFLYQAGLISRKSPICCSF